MQLHQPIGHRATQKRDLPRIWLMTDKRNDERLELAIDRLPGGSGIVFRHYHLNADKRRKLFQKVRKQAKRQGHILLLADSPSLAHGWKADGVHGREWKPPNTANLLHSASVHNLQELAEAKRNKAHVIFLSPVFATRSHPGRKPIGRLQLQRLIRSCNVPIILLGGMNSNRFRQLKKFGAHGWAGIDALQPPASNGQSNQ